MPELNLDAARTMVDAAFKHAKANSWIISVAVLDAGGHLIHASRMDGCNFLAPDIARGKAMGCEGALVLGPKVVLDFLVNRGRPFIFSTAPSPLVCAAVREAVRIMADEPQRREALRALVAHAERVLAPHGALPSGSQILPLILHEDARTMAVAASLQAKGFDVRGIRPPTVPQGTSRLRISLTLNATSEDVDALGMALSEALR